MRPKSALAAGLACAVLAVGAVAADLAWNVEAVLERMEGGSWVVVARAPDMRAEPFSALACSGSQFRLTLHNGLPWDTTVEVSAYAGGMPIEGWTLARWSLGAGASESREFTLPASAFPSEPGPDTSGARKPTASVDVRVGDHYLYACAGAGGSA